MGKSKITFYLGKLFLVLLAFGLSSKLFSAVNAPELRCVSVAANGNITLSWIPPADPLNEFVSYTVYASANQAGPYIPTTVNGLLTSSYTDLVNGNLNSFFYYVVTEYNSGMGVVGSAPSDTAQSILPAFTSTTDSTCTFSWNQVFNPNIPSATGVYLVYRRIGTSGSFTVLGSPAPGALSFNDSFKVCEDSIFYYVETADLSGCVSRSAVLKGLFKDLTAPATPVMDSVTVDGAANQVLLGWEPSSSPDTYGYLVFYFEKITSSYIFRDTVFGRFNTSYLETLPTIDPTTEFQQYTVAAFDSCYYPIPNTSSGTLDQRTIYLDLTPNVCENTVILSWNPYINWPDLAGYEILVSTNLGPYQVAATLLPTDTSYTFSKTNSLDVFCYKVQAFNTTRTKTSTSNRNCALSNATVVPKKQYFKQITVENNSNIHVVALTDTTLPVSEYALFRSLEPLGNFFEVDRIKFKNNPIIQFRDYEAEVNQTSYVYRIGIFDTCGALSYLSTSANSMYLQGNLDQEQLNVSLNWNSYNSWDTVKSGVANYRIYEIVDGKRELFATVDGFTNTYDFSIDERIQEGANFCYEIEAVEDSGNVYNMNDSALSNRVCFTQNLNVFVPNAFRPNGLNPVFKPVIAFGQLANYQMIIYDRWGTKLFETTNYELGWDGTSNGKDVPFGAYVYSITVTNFNGSVYTKQGTLTLLR